MPSDLLVLFAFLVALESVVITIAITGLVIDVAKYVRAKRRNL